MTQKKTYISHRSQRSHTSHKSHRSHRSHTSYRSHTSHKIPKAGRFHFVGIGGVGMSAIAEIMHHLGYEVQGSDIKETDITKRLSALGVGVMIGHKQSNIKGVQYVVVSSAIMDDNKEVQAAKLARLPIIPRGDMLANLMRHKNTITIAGTHGKTTTTSLIASLLDKAGLAPTIINGGIINAYGTNARLGEGSWMVVEADESDGTFVRLPSDFGVITNIDPEHTRHYGGFGALKDAFRLYVENLSAQGCAVLCTDHQEVAKLYQTISNRRLLSYGLKGAPDISATNITYAPKSILFDVCLRGKLSDKQVFWEGFTLPMLGAHNLQNALAALAIGIELGIGEDVLRKGLKDFAGVKRRFCFAGRWQEVDIYDDYAHHPREISAVLQSAKQHISQEDKQHINQSTKQHINQNTQQYKSNKQSLKQSLNQNLKQTLKQSLNLKQTLKQNLKQSFSEGGKQLLGHMGQAKGRVIAVIQPHRYTRLKDLFEDFAESLLDADMVLLAPIYAAGEKPIQGVSIEALAQMLKDKHHPFVKIVKTPSDVAEICLREAKKGDVIILMGAGNITNWAHSLLVLMKEMAKEKGKDFTKEKMRGQTHQGTFYS